MPQVTIHVPPRPYQARIENGLLTRAGSVLAELLPQASRIFVVTVPPVRKRWGAKFVRSLAAAGFKPEVLMMSNGEPAKRLATVEALAEKLARLGAERKAVVIALGGGVVGDVSGLVASLYMRGVEFVQVPTTVLAQVDASIGGKTAVNLAAGKNLLGTFYHPRVVLIDPTVLKTLPDREFRAGLYEALKCGVIGNVELFLRFEQNRARILKRDPAIGKTESRSGFRGRARGRPAPRAQLGPYHRPRARIGNRIPPPVARRGCCLGHDCRHQHRAQRGPYR